MNRNISADTGARRFCHSISLQFFPALCWAVKNLVLTAMIVAYILFRGPGLRFAAKLRQHVAPGFNLGARSSPG